MPDGKFLVNTITHNPRQSKNCLLVKPVDYACVNSISYGAVIRQCKPFAKDKDAIYKLRELVHSMSADDFVGFKNLIDSQGVDKALKAYSLALQI